MRSLLAAVILAVLTAASPAGAGTFTAGLLKLDVPDSWKTVNRTRTVFGDEPLAAAVVLHHSSDEDGRLVMNTFMLAPSAAILKGEADFEAALKGAMLKVYGPGNQPPLRRFGDGRGLWYQTDQDGESSRVLVYSLDGRALMFNIQILPYRTGPQKPVIRFGDLPEKIQTEIMTAWESLNSTDPAYQEFLEKCRAELPPEFFQ